MNFIFLFFYEIVLWIIAFLALPKMMYGLIVYKKYRQSLLFRLGVHFPKFKPSSFPSIWIHAVSVGETQAIVSLARELKQLFPEHPLIISSVTETGHAEALRSLPFADYHIYMPLDFSWIMSKIIKKASPALVILCESDFWLNFLHQAKKSGASLALVNGKISESSMRRMRMIPFFSKRIFNLFDVLCVQNNLYRMRLIKAGALMNKIVVTGNLKLDADYPQLSHEEMIAWRKKLGIVRGQTVLTIGSTHLPEEQALIKILKEIWKENPDLRVILVPRRPEHFKEVALLLEREHLNWINFTRINQLTGKEQVILIDAMGLLRMCYQLSDFAIIGGSFVDHVGGHNILEPCWYCKPILFGPHMHKQVELVDLVTQYQAGYQVNYDQLQSIIEKWIDNPLEAKEIGMKGKSLIDNLKGSTKKTMQSLSPFFQKFKQ